MPNGCCKNWRGTSGSPWDGLSPCETHRGNCDMRWVSQGLNPSYELIESASSCHGSTDQ
jgi:hypothetical protein